jgi:lysophospholipase-2
MAMLQRQRFKNTKFVLPTAPIMPVTLNFGSRCTAWHDILTLETIDDEPSKGIDESAAIGSNKIP